MYFSKINYASATVIELADPSGFGATSDTDGFICAYKNAASGVVTIKNRLGSTKSITVTTITTSD